MYIKKILILILFTKISGTFATLSLQQVNDILTKQHIFLICMKAQADDEPCTIINKIVKNDREWYKMSYLKKLWNFNKRPMPADVTRAVLMAQAKKIGTRMRWSQEYLLEEVELLFNFYENVMNDEPKFKTHIRFK